MTATILDGAKVAADIRRETAEAVAALALRGAVPGLSVLVAGDDPASQVYVRNKEKAAREAGIRAETLRFPSTVTEAMLLAEIGRLNADPEVDAILVQLPLPGGISSARVLEAIDPAKDVDGFHPINVGRLWSGGPALAPCTPLGLLAILDAYGLDVHGRHVVIVGRSHMVGKPAAALFLGRHATVTVAHSRTRDLASVVRSGDVVVAAVGRAGLVTADMVQPGAIVLDVGMTRVDGKIVGDVDDDVWGVAGHMTPMPGGTGLVTVAMVLQNTVTAAERRRG